MEDDVTAGPTARDDVVALGIDVGTTNTKVALVRVLTGVGGGAGAIREIGTAAAPTPPDAAGLVDVVRRLVAEVAARHPGTRPDVVGVASMAETGVPLDSDGAPMTPLLRWDGHRAGDEAAALARTHGREALFAATGVRPSAKVPLATWAWLGAQGVRMHRWAGVADLVVLALTGRLVTDHTLAGRTMAYRATRDASLAPGFDPDLLATVGLRPDHLPAVAPPDAVAGHVVGSPGPGVFAGALAADGVLPPGFLRAGTPVVVAGHDHAVGAWAAGVRRPGQRADSLGTAEAVLTVVAGAPEPAPVAAAGMSWVRTAAGHHALLAGTSSAGAMLDWLAARLPGPLEAPLGDAAELTRHDVGDLVVLPYLRGRQTPAPDPAVRVRVLRRYGGSRDDLGHDEELDDAEVRALGAADGGALARAVLLGVCLQARWMADEQRALGGVREESPLVVLGGAARTIRAWATLKRRTTRGGLAWVEAREPVAVGAAVLGAARAGLLGRPSIALSDAPALPATVAGTVVGTAADDPPGADAATEDALRRFVAAATGATYPTTHARGR